jgi:MFS family permease
MNTPAQKDLERNSWRFSAGAGLAILAFINLFNYLDRYVVSAVFESLKHSLALTDANLGSLISAFLLVYTLTAPLFGALGDRRNRPRLIAFGVFFWSLATALSGFAGSYLWLLGARASVGIGEAAYGTIAPSLLADYFPEAQRGRIMAIFFCAIPVGSALGYVVGGLVDVHWGWRAAFFVAGGPGIALALLCLWLRDPPRGIQDGAVPQPTPASDGPLATRHARASLTAATWATYRRLFANLPYRLTIFGYAAYTFAIGGLAAWMPAFLERVRGYPTGTAAISFGKIVVVTGLVGTFVGGWLGDYCRRYSRESSLVVRDCDTACGAVRLGRLDDFFHDPVPRLHGHRPIADVPVDGPRQCRDREPGFADRARFGRRSRRVRDSHLGRRVLALADRLRIGRHLARASGQDRARGGRHFGCHLVFRGARPGAPGGRPGGCLSSCRRRSSHVTIP